MRTVLYFLTIGLFSLSGYSQIDRTTGTQDVEGLGVPSTPINSPLKLDKNPSLSKKKGILGNSSKPDPFGEKEKGFKMITDDGLKDYKVEFKPKYLHDKPVRDEFKKDAYLGDFKTDGVFVDIMYRDHEYVDGDKIRIIVNDSIVESSITLVGSFRGTVVKLKKGLNRIDFLALNQGSSGPNTAQFRVYDDQGKLLSENVWNLATGYKGTIIVVKD